MSRADCDVCDEEFARLHGQIVTLKAALIDRDLRLLGDCLGECPNHIVLGRAPTRMDCDKCAREVVIRQLAQEYPHIAWEEKK